MTSRSSTQRDGQIEAVLRASQAMVAIVTRSFAETEKPITLPQWRVLVILSGHGPLNPGSVAQWMGVHPSNTTRTCDALVKAGLVNRRENPDDRRQIMLTLTEDGQELVESLLMFRRQAIGAVLDNLSAAQRKQLAEAMQDFANAAGESPERFAPATAWTR